MSSAVFFSLTVLYGRWIETWVNLFFKGIIKSSDFGCFPRGHEIYQVSREHHPVSSTCQVNHSTQRNNEILPSFWGEKWLITSQVRPLQFSTYCKMLAKCFNSSFVDSSVWLWFLYWHPVVSPRLFVLPCQTSQAFENLIILEHLSRKKIYAKLTYFIKYLWQG